MKKWTDKQASSNTVITEAISQEYSQYKQVFNGGLDRTALPASYFTKTHVKNETFHKCQVFYVGVNSHFIQTSGYAPTDREFICQNYSTYLGGEYLAATETVDNIKSGWVNIELASMFFCSTENLNYQDNTAKELYVRLVWNGETIATAGPFTKSMYSYRICAGTYTAAGTGTLSIYIRGAGPHQFDNTTDQTYHWWNMQGFILARWR